MYRLLSLGDSYTIGEAVAQEDNFPNKTIRLLENNGKKFAPPTIIAKTGWTSAELISEIGKYRNQLVPGYDFVTLLIGVNNQYRGQDLITYRSEFKHLAEFALSMVGELPSRVCGISIPDWGVTPYAHGKDREKISREIDEFNEINKEVAIEFGLHYIYITHWTREAGGDATLLTSDGLHPSAKEYARWAAKLSELIINEVQ